MYLSLGVSRHQASLRTTAYLGPGAAAEWTCGVHSDYALLPGCGPEGLSSGVEAVLLCILLLLFLLRALRLDRELALGSHGCSGAPRGTSGYHVLCTHLSGTVPTYPRWPPTVYPAFIPILSPRPKPVLCIPDPPLSPVTGARPEPCPVCPLRARQSGSFSSLALQCVGRWWRK